MLLLQYQEDRLESTIKRARYYFETAKKEKVRGGQKKKGLLEALG